MFHCIQFSGELMTKREAKKDEVIKELQRQEAEKEKIGDQVRKIVNDGSLRDALLNDDFLQRDDKIDDDMVNWIIDAIDDKFIRLADEKAKRCPECLIPTRKVYKNEVEKDSEGLATTTIIATGERFCPRCKTRYRETKDERGNIKLTYKKARQ
jgi:hypothetical protein